MLTRIVDGEVDGRPLTHDEQLGMCHLLLLGGLDTVTATLDCMITYLAQHPDRRQAVVDDPELMEPVIEELLRHQTPVMMLPRVIAQDYELGGVKMTAGDSATLMIGAANCDRAEFDDASEVMLDREREPPPRVRRRPAPLPRLAPGAPGAEGRAPGVPQADPRVRDRRGHRGPLLARHPPGGPPAAGVPRLVVSPAQ